MLNEAKLVVKAVFVIRCAEKKTSAECLLLLLSVNTPSFPLFCAFSASIEHQVVVSLSLPPCLSGRPVEGMNNVYEHGDSTASSSPVTILTCFSPSAPSGERDEMSV